MRFVFIFCFSFIFQLVIGQIKCNNFFIQKNSSLIADSIKRTKNKSILFFCATYDIDSTKFIKKADELLKNKKLSNIGEVHIYFIYFKQDPKRNSNGIIIKNNSKNEEIVIGQSECFFLNFDKKNIVHASKKMKYNFEFSEPFSKENFFKISIVDTNKCFAEIPDRIPFYGDFIKEVVNPTYSVDDKINQLTDSLINLKQLIENLKLQNKNVNKRIDSLFILNNNQKSLFNKPKKSKLNINE